MSTSVELTGVATRGLYLPGELRAAGGISMGIESLLSALPSVVKLGRIAPRSRPQSLRLESFVDLLKTTPKPAVDWYTKARESIARMYLNDRYGCCVFSGKAHNLGIWSANDPDSADGRTVLATDQEIYDQYFAYTGGRDVGAVIFQVLDYMIAKGFQAGGKRYKLSGWVSADWRSKELTQIGIDLFGCASIGFNLPNAWTNEVVWDVTNSQIIGGHDVSPCGYGTNVLGTNADGVVVSSWGRLYLITWAAWTSSRWLDELYFMVPEFLWTGLDQRAPSGVDFGKLKEALTLIGGGTVPPLPEPTPTPPPVPPVPPVPPTPPTPPVPTVFPNYKGTLRVPLLGNLEINLSPVATGDGPMAMVDWHIIAIDIGKLLTDVGNENWGEIFADVYKILQDFGLFSAQQAHMMGRSAPVVPWRVVIMDAIALVSAAMAKDIPGIVAALLKLAADFGLMLSENELRSNLRMNGVSI